MFNLENNNDKTEPFRLMLEINWWLLKRQFKQSKYEKTELLFSRLYIHVSISQADKTLREITLNRLLYTVEPCCSHESYLFFYFVAFIFVFCI